VLAMVTGDKNKRERFEIRASTEAFPSGCGGPPDRAACAAGASSASAAMPRRDCHAALWVWARDAASCSADPLAQRRPRVQRRPHRRPQPTAHVGSRTSRLTTRCRPRNSRRSVRRCSGGLIGVEEIGQSGQTRLAARRLRRPWSPWRRTYEGSRGLKRMTKIHKCSTCIQGLDMVLS